MLWKMIMFVLIVMPVLMLAFFVVAMAAPQLGMLNGVGLSWGAGVSFVLAFPVSWYLSKKISELTKVPGA